MEVCLISRGRGNDLACYSCGRSGHFATCCRSASSTTSASTTRSGRFSGSCFVFGERGHRACECPRRARPERQAHVLEASEVERARPERQAHVLEVSEDESVGKGDAKWSFEVMGSKEEQILGHESHHGSSHGSLHA
mmetsp:Transcript_78518/g.254996  ORF Transcript_78518/g.254996 Transcript_78518/m.254996 type:complete len:137 (+) Transcript_78518:262-672(+)